MLSRDYRDIIGGLVLMLIGAVAAVYAFDAYPLGTLRRMGPGFFPAYLGALLVVLGLIIFLPALFRAGPQMPEIEWRSLVFISLAGLFFALGVNRVGIVPSVMGVVLISALADNKLSLRAALVYSTALAIGCWVIFAIALDLPVQAFRWRL